MSCGADGPLGRPSSLPRPWLRHRLSPARGSARVRAGFVERGREGVAVPTFRVGGGGTPFRRLRFLSVSRFAGIAEAAASAGLPARTRDGTGVFDETNADGAARGLDAAGGRRPVTGGRSRTHL